MVCIFGAIKNTPSLADLVENILLPWIPYSFRFAKASVQILGDTLSFRLACFSSAYLKSFTFCVMGLMPMAGLIGQKMENNLNQADGDF